MLCQGPGLPPCLLEYTLGVGKAGSWWPPRGLANASPGTLSSGRRDGWRRGLAAAHFHSPFTTPPAPGCPVSDPTCPDALASLTCMRWAAEGPALGAGALGGSLAPLWLSVQ